MHPDSRPHQRSETCLSAVLFWPAALEIRETPGYVTWNLTELIQKTAMLYFSLHVVYYVRKVKLFQLPLRIFNRLVPLPPEQQLITDVLKEYTLAGTEITHHQACHRTSAQHQSALCANTCEDGIEGCLNCQPVRSHLINTTLQQSTCGFRLNVGW